MITIKIINMYFNDILNACDSSTKNYFSVLFFPLLTKKNKIIKVININGLVEIFEDDTTPAVVH